MGELRQQAEPAAVGLDPRGLARLDGHFARYVDEGRLAGYLIAIARHGLVAHLTTYGQRDQAAGSSVEPGTVWRMYSMTKPVTSVAAMMLHERGLLGLAEPVARYLPAFARPRVYLGGAGRQVLTRPAAQPITVWHLLTHTAGLTRGTCHGHPVDALYRAAGLEWSAPGDADLAATCDLYASLPLQFDPGTQWNYSVATNLLGRVIEVVSGQPLDEFFAGQIFGPLGMDDAGFFAGPRQAGRLAALYRSDEAGRAVPSAGRPAVRRPRCLAGGSGLVASALDYHRFMEMLRGHGELDGTRLLSARGVRSMTANQLPGGADLRTFGSPVHAHAGNAGMGFGLGVSVTIDPGKAGLPSCAGEYGWSGAAGTVFWIDPGKDLTVQFLTQLESPAAMLFPAQLKRLVYAALTG